jgi:hypothetical protein
MTEPSTADRLAIHELVARYCHCIDRGRWDELVDLFTADCCLDLSQVLGRYEGRDGLRQFADTMRPLGLFMRHFVTNVVVHIDGDSARAESYVIAMTGAAGKPQQATGFYDDEFVKRDGGWLFQRRRLTLDVPAA